MLNGCYDYVASIAFVQTCDMLMVCISNVHNVRKWQQLGKTI